MPRPQFSLKTLLWLMAVVAAFFSGEESQRRQYKTERYNMDRERMVFYDANRGAAHEINRLKTKLAELEKERVPASQAPRFFLPKK